MIKKSTKHCTIRELAKYVGLSTCTVSRVLNDPGHKWSIPETTRQLVKSAAERLNYVPEVNAQRFFRKKSNVIGFLVPPHQDESESESVFHDQHLATILGSVAEELRQTDYNLMMLFNDQETKESGRYESMFRSHLLDGLLIWGIHRDDFYWNELANMQTPIVFLNNTPGEGAPSSVNYVANDFEFAAYQVSRQLFAQGCRHPLWMGAIPGLTLNLEVQHGIQRAMREVGPPPDALRQTHCGYLQLDFGGFFEMIKNCDGVIAPSHNAARVLANILPTLQRNIPMVCLDSSAANAVPCVPTMLPDDEKIGREGVRYLLKLMENRAAPTEPLVQMRIQGKPFAFTCP